MGFNPLGIKTWLESADAAQAEEKRRQDERESLAFQLQMQYGAETSLKSKGSGKGSVKSPELAAKVLMKKYGVSSDVLSEFTASDTNAPNKLLTILEKQEKEYGVDGRDLPQDRINEILESAVAQQPTETKLDFTKIEEFIGRPLQSVYKEVLQQSEASSGEVYFSDPAVVPQPTFTELQQIPKSAAQWQQSGAITEQNIIIKRITDLERIPQEERTDSVKNEVKLLSDRLRKVTSALDNFESNPGLLIDLYGNSTLKHLLSKYPKYDGYIPENFINSQYSRPLVASEEMAKVLLKAGIVEEGTIFRLPNGELIEVMKEPQ